MSVDPISSSASLSVISKQSEDLKVSGTIQTKDGSTIQFELEYQHTESAAARVSIGDNSSAGQEVNKIAYGRHHHREKNFKAIDANGDGSLSKDELEAAQKERQESGHKTPFIDRALANYDSLSAKNSAGGISLQQFYPHPKKNGAENSSAELAASEAVTSEDSSSAGATLSDYTDPQNIGPSGSSDIFAKDPEPAKSGLTDYQVQQLTLDLTTAATVLSSISGNAPTINVGIAANGKLIIA